MRRDEHEEVTPDTDETKGDIEAAFPKEDNPHLDIAKVTLPDAPKMDWKRPQTEAAGTKPQKASAVADLRGAGIGYTIGITLVTSILIGTGLGYAVDKFLFGSPATPWGLIIGFLIGMVTGFVQMFSITNRLNAEEDAARTGKGR